MFPVEGCGRARSKETSQYLTPKNIMPDDRNAKGLWKSSHFALSIANILTNECCSLPSCFLKTTTFSTKDSVKNTFYLFIDYSTVQI